MAITQVHNAQCKRRFNILEPEEIQSMFSTVLTRIKISLLLKMDDIAEYRMKFGIISCYL